MNSPSVSEPQSTGTNSFADITFRDALLMWMFGELGSPRRGEQTPRTKDGRLGYILSRWPYSSWTPKRLIPKAKLYGRSRECWGSGNMGVVNFPLHSVKGI